MVDSIKITALQDIGANIAYTTLVPLVNMAGTPTTQKANLQNLGNLILNGAGGSYFAPAARAISSQAVTNAAQPNITSVGTLTSLVVTGNIRAGNANLGNIATANFYYGDGGFLTNVSANGSYSNSNVANYLPTYTGNVGAGNVNATGTVYTSGISSTGLASLTILNVSTTANLGAVGNVRIAGGSAGQKLTTDGAGNLSWTNDANSSYGNTNVANYLPTFTGTVGANTIRSTANSGSNLQIDANGAIFTFGQGGALYWPAIGGGQKVIETNIDSEFEIKSTTNVVISTDTSNANSHFTFDSDGIFTAPSNVNLLGSRLNVGPAAANISNLASPTLIIANSAAEFIQASIINNNPNGSADWTAQGANSDDEQGFSDLGFAGHSFNDPNFTITAPGDGYVFAQGYANGIGGGLVLATGENGNVPDIVFATGGFLANNEFARIDHANDVFHLTRAGSGIQFADGSIQTTAGGGSGYIIPYTVDTFVANTQPGFGEIQFANFEGANSAPATAQKLFINQAASNEQTLGTIFQQWTSNSYRGTLSLNNGSDSQATFNISNGRIYFEPETYRGFNAGLNQIWGDDCSINQLIITNATAPKFYNTDFLVEDDVFHATGLDTGNTHVMLNVYGSSQYNPINPQDLWNMFVAFVDGVLYDGETLRTDTSAIKSAFYNNGGNFTNNIPTQDLFQYFRFTQSSGADYFASAPTTTNGAGDGATLRLRVNADGTYVLLGITNAGVGYQVGDTLTVLGTDLGGTSPANNLVVTVGTVDISGSVTVITYTSGTGVYPWPPNFISDGSDDQYDTGNYLNTNLATEISYANGLPQTDSAAFGGGDYCVMYNPSFFCMVATGTSSSMNELFYSGSLGFDGDGDLNWTGLRNNQSVIANNNALYAYFDSEYLDGELTPTVGTTYNMTLDSAGINLDGFYAYNDDNTGDTFFGSNNDWRVESQSQLYLQSYNDMIIQTLVNQRGTGETGPALNVRAGSGSPGQREINATAGNGGTVNVNGGDAGGSDGIDGLGNTGGSVNITGGLGTGNFQAGNVNLYGGEGANAGSINLYTDFGANSSGKVKINTYDGNTNKTWEFRPDGSTIYPTLTVTRGDRTGTLTGQTILFGDSTQEAILTTPNGTSDINSSQRFVINPGAGYANTTGEGGDIYLYAGRGGDAGGSGGDIKVRGGLGPVNGDGGYIDIIGGEADANGTGGYIDIQGGQSGNGNGGDVSIIGGQGRNGGDANITGGTSTAGPGGPVNITGGTSSNGLAEYGNVNITSGASTWTFDNTGNLVLPTNDFTVNYANGTQVTFGAAAIGNVTFDDVTIQGVNQLNLSAGPDYTANLAYLQVRAGDVASHIHFDTGNNEAYDLIVGNDQKFVQVSSTGNIIMSSYDGNTSYTMKLDTTGNVTFPGVLGVVGGTTTPVTGNNEAGNPGVSGSQTFNAQVSYFPTVGDIQVGWTVTGNNLIGTTTVTVVDEYSPGFFEITTDTSVTNAFWYGDAYTFTGNGTSNWVFANDNILTFPRDEIANTDPYLRIEGGTNPRILSEDASLAGPANLEITALNTIFTGSTGSEIRIYPDDGEVGSTGNLELWANAGSNVAQYNWTFDTTGNLTLPGNTWAVNYANGAQVSLGGGSSISNGTSNVDIASSGGNVTVSVGGTSNVIVATTTGANVTGTLTTTGKIGYANGGTVTQTSSGQGVTINQLTGQITLAKSSWTAGDLEIFNVNCNKVGTYDYVVAQVINGTESTFFNVVAFPYVPLANSFQIQVRAMETTTSTPLVQFFIMKAAIS